MPRIHAMNDCEEHADKFIFNSLRAYTLATALRQE